MVSAPSNGGERWVSLAEVTQPIVRADPQRTPGTTVSYIDISAIDAETKRVVRPQRVLGIDAPSRARQSVRAGDILVSTVRPNLNTVALLDESHEGSLASTGFCVLRPDPTVLDASYAFHWVRTPQFVGELVQQATGASYPAVTDKIVKRTAIPLPSIAEQRRIAEVLDVADALRAKRREALAKLERLAQVVFVDMFGDPVKGEPTTFGDLAIPGRGAFSNGPFGSDLLSSELVGTGVPVVYIRDIRDGKYNRVSTVCVSSEKSKSMDSCQVVPGDVLLAKVGDPPGTAAVYPEAEPLAVITQDVIRIRLRTDTATPLFVAALLNSRYGRHLIRSITVDATRARFGLGDLKRLRLNLPPLSLQHEFDRRLTVMETTRRRIEDHLTLLDSLFASLQQRAFRADL